MSTIPGIVGAQGALAPTILVDVTSKKRHRLRNACAPTTSYLRMIATALLLMSSLAVPRAHAASDAEALRSAAAAERARPAAPRFPRIDFIARPALTGAWLSPDGRHVAYLHDAGRGRGVWLLPTRGGSPTRLLADTDAEALSWSRDSRWLFIASPTQLSVLATAGQPGSGAIGKLGGRAERSFVAIDPVMPAAAIVLERPPLVSRSPKRWRLYRIDARGHEALLHEDTRQVVGQAFDARGRLAYLVRIEGAQYVVLRNERNALRPVLRCGALYRCLLAGMAADGRGALLETDLGTGYLHLARMDPDGRLHALHADPRGEADLDEAVFDPRDGRPLVASYRSTVPTNHGLDPDTARHVHAIERRWPGRDLRIEVGRGPGARWLVHERAGSLKGERLHLYDPADGATRDILAGLGFQHERTAVARLPEMAMARRLPFAWRASDGMRLHGFVSVPPGVDPSRAPLVAFVHGGPFNHARPAFSAQAQLLANRGYVVFEPNFRGSTGHGRAYMRAGNGDFGNGRVQQDIVEGARSLLEQGIGDRRRVGIVGASFGGYAALQGVTFQPALFKVAIAAVPPADLGWVLRWYARSVDRQSRGIPLSATMRLLALDPSDPAVMARLRAQSPIANAARLRRPVLLLAGGDDERVPIRSVLHYAATLHTLGKDVSLFVDEEGTHQLPSPLTREAYLYLIESMLHRVLGGAALAPPSKALRAHLRKHMQLVGRGLSMPSKDAPASRTGR